jgi:hypothetical protein
MYIFRNLIYNIYSISLNSFKNQTVIIGSHIYYALIETPVKTSFIECAFKKQIRTESGYI